MIKLTPKIIVSLLILFFAFTVFAQTIIFPNPILSPTFMDFLKRLIATMRPFIAGLAVIMVGYAAFLYVTAGGSPERVKAAHRILVWTIVGFTVLVLAEGIIQAVCGFIGVSC